MKNTTLYIPEYVGGSYEDRFEFISKNAYRNREDAEDEILSMGFVRSDYDPKDFYNEKADEMEYEPHYATILIVEVK